MFAASRRRIEPRAAAAIARETAGVGTVGVFVNQPLGEVREIAGLCRLDFVQLHGDEPPGYCRAVGRKVIKAFRVDGAFDPSAMDACGADWLLLDSFVPGRTGGTGTAFDWRQAAPACRRLTKPFFAAGGLSAITVAEAVRLLNPTGVDVSGGVETNGVKDPDKIREFIAAAKAARGG